MPKLLIVTTIPETLKAFLLPYSDYFRKKGWQVDAMTGKGSVNDLICHFNKVWQVNWSRNPTDLRNFIGTPQRINKIVEQEGYDIVHVHTPVAAFVSRFALRNLRKKGKVKVIYTAHGFHFYKGNSFLKNAIFLSIEKLAASWTDHLIVINEEDYEAGLKYGLGSRKTITLHPGIGLDLEVFSPDKVSDEDVKYFRDTLGLKTEDLLFVMIAEFNPGKRHSDCLEAFALLKQHNAYLAFVGKGCFEREIVKKAKSLGIADKVFFLGYSKEIPIILRAANASILPSEREGMPRVIMESMSMAVPVIASDIRGNRDLLKNGGGFLYPTGDIIELARNMQLLILDANRAIREGLKGKENIIGYRIEELLAKHENVYVSVLNKNKNP